MNLIQNLKQIKCYATFSLKMFINIFLLKKKNPQIKVHTYKSLVKTIIKRNDTCHIIATGYSAIASHKAGIVKENDYVIGFNFAAFLPYKFDFYFCEETSHVDASDERTKNQINLLNKRKNSISNIVFKNFYDSDPKLMGKLISNEYSIVMDRQLIRGNIITLLSKPSIMMPQYASTVITATILAYNAGFKNIIIHGLDFSGPHIYHNEDLQKQVEMSPPTPYVSKEQKHVTASYQEKIWPNLIKELQKRGIKIFCACAESKFSNYAPIYNN